MPEISHDAEPRVNPDARTGDNLEASSLNVDHVPISKSEVK